VKFVFKAADTPRFASEKEIALTNAACFRMVECVNINIGKPH
jgi:hypothetical protein